jgi:hypothetical protein
MVYDKLPRGVRNSVDHNIRDLERFLLPLEDRLDTLRHMAGPLFIGLDSDVSCISELVDEIKRRWAYYQANDAWASSEEVRQQLPRASSSGSTDLVKGDE